MSQSKKIAQLKIRLARVKERTDRPGGTEIINVAVAGTAEELTDHLMRKGAGKLLSDLNKKGL
jgi:hypothetical protein